MKTTSVFALLVAIGLAAGQARATLVVVPQARPEAREPAPRAAPERTVPAAAERRGQGGGGAEAAPVNAPPRPRPAAAAAPSPSSVPAACSDELTEVSLGIDGAAQERLRRQKCD